MIKVLIVDDEPLVRIGIKSSIDWEGNGLELAAEASNGEQALELVDAVKPDIVITDIRMPAKDGIELIKELKRKYPQILPVVLSCFDDFEYVREAMRYGAVDYFLKTRLDPDSILKILLGLKERIDKNRQAAINESINKKLIGECISILTDNFVKDLISGLVTSEQERSDKIRMYNLGVLEQKYALMVLEIDNFSDVKLKYIEKDEKLLQFSMKNLLEELYGRVPGFRMFIDKSKEYIICWPVNQEVSGRRQEEEIKDAASRIIRVIKDYLNISVSIGISSRHIGISEIKDAYNEGKRALGFKFLRGKGCVVNFTDIRMIKDQSKLEVIDGTIENRLKFAVKAVDISIVYKAIACIKERIAGSGVFINDHSAKKVYTSLIELFNSYLREENLDIKADMDPYRKVLEAEDLEELHRGVERYFTVCFEKVSRISEVKGRNGIKQALDYINNYYDKDISLKYIADKVGLNPSYFSRFFKKETGESFIDYLTKIRIEKSKQLLSKGIKAVEAAEKVGYPNYTYFSKLFKKTVGINPSDYSEGKEV